MTTVRVHPSFAIPYYAFYLEGIGRIFGFESIVFDDGDMPTETTYRDGFAFTVESGTESRPQRRRIYISANDWARYDSVALSWCDRYGMINHDPSALISGDSSKVVPIGPSFGVRDWGGLLRTSTDILRILRADVVTRRTDTRRLGALRKQIFERLPERYYLPGQSSGDYIFFVGWPWKKHTEVNPPRARFVRACKATDAIHFEGGFAPRRRRDVPGIEDIEARRIYPFREWVQRTQRSAVVFNCPAVHACLGWKLGEFLALGKAIISIPLSRQMPAPFLHGEHVHFVADDQTAMQEAIALLVRDDAYRKRLEINARRYYLTHLAPERVIQRLVFED